MNKKTNLSKRASVIYSICSQQLDCSSISKLKEIRLIIVYLCKIIIRLRYNKKKNDKKNVRMREEESEDFKIDLLPICEWIWTQKMEATPMEIQPFAENLSAWMEEII